MQARAEAQSPRWDSTLAILSARLWLRSVRVPFVHRPQLVTCRGDIPLEILDGDQSTPMHVPHEVAHQFGERPRIFISDIFQSHFPDRL